MATSTNPPGEKQVQIENLPDPDLSSNAEKILHQRYLLRNEDNEVIETPKQLFLRVARNVASANKKYHDNRTFEEETKEFYEALVNMEFIPNSPTLMNADTEIQQLSACFVLPVEDDMDAIYEAIRNTALIHKSGGGTGFSFSRLRPRGAPVKSTGGIASGPVSFMKVFNKSTDVIKQGGKRRGANMGILRVDHPDIEEFIEAKSGGDELQNFNISVAVTDQFMEALENKDTYELISPRNGETVGEKDAEQIFHKIAEHSHRNGDPGTVFIDRINQDNPFPVENRHDEHWIEATNPCGEQPLEPFEACNLGHVNLAKAVEETEENGYRIDWKHLEKVTKLGTRFLDNVIDVNQYPVPEIQQTVAKNRKIGLGVMGFHDLLLKLRIPYDSDQALETAENVMQFIKEAAAEESREIAESRGNFPTHDESVYDEPRRNSTLTTIAPTGTTGMLADVSTGIEPLYGLTYTKNVLDGEEMVETNDELEKVAKQEGFFSDDLVDHVKETGSVQNLDQVPNHVKQVFKTALEIDPSSHVKIQARFQKHVDNAVSKTINFPNDASVKEVEEAYLQAWRYGCKGLTIYLDGSRNQQVMETSETEESVENQRSSGGISPRKRPEVVQGETEKIEVGCGKSLYLTCNTDEDGLFEVFAQIGKSGGCVASFTEANARLISTALRAGVDPAEIIEQLQGIRCPDIGFREGGKIYSCSDAIAQSMERFVRNIDGNQLTLDDFDHGPPTQRCPDCGANLVHTEGCLKCSADCGWSKC